MISRAGAGAIAEICAIGRPSLLVPLPLSGDHQLYNAQALERAGAAPSERAVSRSQRRRLLAERIAELASDPDAPRAHGRERSRLGAAGLPPRASPTGFS